MFRLKKKENILSPEEESRLRASVIGQQAPQTQFVPKSSPREYIQQIQQPIKFSGASQYFIGKSETTRQKKTIETKSGQIIELPEDDVKSEIKEIYNLTQEDIIDIIRSIESSKTISQLALKMLTNEL